MADEKYPFPQGMPKPKGLWMYTVEYADTKELVNKGVWRCKRVSARMNLDEIDYLKKVTAVTIVNVFLDDASVYY